MVFRRIALFVLGLGLLSPAVMACFHGEVSPDDDSVESVDRSEWSAQRQAVEEQFETALEMSRKLGSTENQEAEELEERTMEALDAAEEAREKLDLMMESGEPEKSAWAALLIGQAYASGSRRPPCRDALRYRATRAQPW